MAGSRSVGSGSVYRLLSVIYPRAKNKGVVSPWGEWLQSPELIGFADGPTSTVFHPLRSPPCGVTVPGGLFLILLAPSLLSAGDDKKNSEKPEKPEKKDATKPLEVEVRFGDGSNVRMLLLQESIDVETKYGKLSIPTKDIRGIDLGVHLPEGTAKKIEMAIKKLNSPSFKERDQAVNDLVEMGAHSYPALMKAAGTSELEVSQRVQAALKRIKAKVSTDLLRTNFNDRVITTDFPIAGRIVSTTLKAKTPPTSATWT